MVQPSLSNNKVSKIPFAVFTKFASFSLLHLILLWLRFLLIWILFFITSCYLYEVLLKEKMINKTIDGTLAMIKSLSSLSLQVIPIIKNFKVRRTRKKFHSNHVSIFNPLILTSRMFDGSYLLRVHLVIKSYEVG